MNISQIKKQLENTTDNQEKAKLLSQIEALKEKAEGKIRAEQKVADFQTQEFTVELIVSKYGTDLETGENELFIPDYQRDFVWDERKQSRLIESLLLGFPIPYIFTADVSSLDNPLEDGRIEIVDGSQRIRTLHAYINNELELSQLEALSELNGSKYEDLMLSRQRRFLRTPIRIIELSENCSEETRRDLFERINTGSEALRAMEVRRGSEIGSSELYNEILIPCSINTLFQKLAPMTDAKLKRKEPLEFVLRFFAYLNNYENFSKRVDEFMSNYMRCNQTPSKHEKDKMIREFKEMLTFVSKYFPLGFRKTESARSTPRVRFECISVGVALALRENPNLSDPDISWLYSNEFAIHTTSDASNSKPKLIARIEYVKNKLLKNDDV